MPDVARARPLAREGLRRGSRARSAIASLPRSPPGRLDRPDVSGAIVHPGATRRPHDRRPWSRPRGRGRARCRRRGAVADR